MTGITPTALTPRRLCVRPLTVEDASQVASLLRSQPARYSRMFYVFDTDEVSIATQLSAAQQDIYFGMYWNDMLVSVAMLRGWDEGYAIPSFGILVDEKYKGKQVMRVLLDAAKLVCRMSDVKCMMAKIHPENVSIRGAMRLGFRHVGTESATGNHIYHMDL